MADLLEVVYTVLEVLIAVASCLGNALVVWALWTGVPRQEATFCFMASLAVADFLVGAVGMPMSVLVDGRVEVSFHWCLVTSCVVLLFPQSSVLALLAIATYRFLRVHIPLRYKSLVTQHRSWGAVALCWLVAGALSVTPVLWWSDQPLSSNSTSTMCRFVEVILPAFLVYFTTVSYTVVPLLGMMALYGGIFFIITQRLQQGLRGCDKPQSYYRKERNLVKSLVLGLLLFVICWMPLHIMNCLSFFVSQDMVPREAVYVGILLSHVHSALNPIVYGFRIHRICTACVHLLGSCVTRFQEEQDRTSQSHSSRS
ncbi:adenosine receptor A1-like [Scleropages formosus]|nr:adenosine receptor A1-like [Scleropages formosus]